jgi:hypothetical protein
LFVKKYIPQTFVIFEFQEPGTDGISNFFLGLEECTFKMESTTLIMDQREKLDVGKGLASPTSNNARA